MLTWTDEQVDQWCLALYAYREDSTARAEAVELRILRSHARQAMLQHLHSFIESQSTLQNFNTVFQQQTNYDWSVFGVRGMSGGMFLNKLVKYIPHDEQLTQQLRTALVLPKDAREGQYLMQALIFFLEGIIATGQIHRSQLQPARFPFFLSAWWHIQDEEQWPRFAGHLRQRVLHGLPLANPATNLIELYFAFRERFIALKDSFGISAWELEHFLTWQEQKSREQVHIPEDSEGQQRREKHKMSEFGKVERKSLPSGPTRRLYLQWVLAKIGKKVGCQVWIARQDQEKSWKDSSFQQLSIPSLPFTEEGRSKALLEEIAVLWLQKSKIIAAYEIDPKTSEIVSSLLHLYGLNIAYNKHQPHLCLVLPKPQFEQAYRELSHPFFCQQQEKQRCALMSIEDLAHQAEHILRWATSPLVLKDLLFSSGDAQASMPKEKAFPETLARSV